MNISFPDTTFKVDDLQVQKCVTMILERAKGQPQPLKKGTEYDDFFETMGAVWHVADKFHLDIPFTNFLMFGPQSAGKTTVTERIIGFPVAVVKSEIGTTRPTVITTRHAKEEGYKVKSSSDKEYQPKTKEEIMGWVKDQMAATGRLGSGRPKISEERIYVEACGPQYKNRRFVDLPGFQSNDENGKEDILKLLRDELRNPNTVVVCIEDARVEYANSNVVQALEAVVGQNFARQPKFAERFVLVLNKSDSWLDDGGVSTIPFLSRISTYADKCGLVPILAGASVDSKNKALRRDRGDGTAAFADVVAEYQNADSREKKLYNEKFAELSLPAELEECLTDRFCGFDTLLRTVDAMVVSRDRENAKGIANQIAHIRTADEKKLENLMRMRDLLCGDDSETTLRESKRVVRSLLHYTSQIATNKWGDAGAFAAMDEGEIERFGNDARMEEMEFVFGERNGLKAPPRNHIGKAPKGYYDPNRVFPVILGGRVVNMPPAVKENWQIEMYKTILKLESEKIGGISRLGQKLINGQLYKRAFAVWASTVYRLVAPSASDLTRLPNTIGINPQLNDDSSSMVKAQRLTQIYIHRLTPAINFLCQKIEFLLLKNFDTAWRVLLRVEDRSKAFVDAVGSEDFMAEVRRQFQKAVQKRAEQAYDMCFSDLNNEVLKLLPYSKDSASITGMLYAFPNVGNTIADTKKSLKERIKKQLDKFFPDGLATAFITGIQHGAELLAVASAINPLFFAGLTVAVNILKPVITTIVAQRKLQTDQAHHSQALEEDRDLELLGFAACLYSNFLPSFIETVDARLRGGLWACVEDGDLVNELEEFIVESDIVLDAQEKIEGLKREIKTLQDRAQQMDLTNKRLMSVVSKFPAEPEHTPAPAFEDGSNTEDWTFSPEVSYDDSGHISPTSSADSLVFSLSGPDIEYTYTPGNDVSSTTSTEAGRGSAKTWKKLVLRRNNKQRSSLDEEEQQTY